MKYLLDTHIWIWWNSNPDQLSKKVKASILNQEEYDEILLSAISPWEFAKLIQKGRLAISIDPEEWIEEALQIPKLRLVPITPKIAYKSTTLPEPIHSDPADQIILATAREENAVLLTKDNRLLNYKYVNSLW